MIPKLYFLCSLALLTCSCSRENHYDLAVRDVSLIDVANGTIANNVNIGVVGGKVVYVGAEAVDSESVVSGEGLWAVPGLWDMHVHISDPTFFKLFVMNGIVGVRDMGGALEKPGDGCSSIEINTLKSWRNGIRRGEIEGPEIVLAGPVLSGTGAAGTLKVTTPTEAEAAIAKIALSEPDFIKVYENIPLDAFTALARAAAEADLVLAGHVSEETLTILDALREGQRSVEHVRSHLLLCFSETEQELERLYTSDGWDADDRAWAKRHRELCTDVWNAFGASDAWLTPTLAVQETMEIGGLPEFITDSRRSKLPPSILQAVAERGQALSRRTVEEVREAKNWNAFIHRLVRRANMEGASLLAGSDAACEGVIPGHGLHRELELLVQAGLSPLRALQTATTEPARYFEREDEIGKIMRGFQADIVLLRRNPLEDISAIADIEAVIVNGEIVPSD